MAGPPTIVAGRVWIESDVFDIDRRIKYGDESGWRGDPSMGLQWNPSNGRYEVWGIDRAGTQYLAASHERCDHTLLQKLVAGDPRKVDVIAGVLEANRKAAADREAADTEARLAAHDKLGWAIRQDFGHLSGGRKIMHSMYDGKKASN